MRMFTCVVHCGKLCCYENLPCPWPSPPGWHPWGFAQPSNITTLQLHYNYITNTLQLHLNYNYNIKNHQLGTHEVLHNPSKLQYYNYNCNYKYITLQLQFQHYKPPGWHPREFAQPVNITSTLHYLNTSHHINNPQKCKHSSTTTYLFIYALTSSLQKRS